MLSGSSVLVGVLISTETSFHSQPFPCKTCGFRQMQLWLHIVAVVTQTEAQQVWQPSRHGRAPGSTNPLLADSAEGEKWTSTCTAALPVHAGIPCFHLCTGSLVDTLSLPCVGLKPTGMAGIWWQAVMLLVAVFPVWLTQLGARIPESSTTHVLLGGLVASRFGLWLFDLAVSQMLQEWIDTEELGELLDAVVGQDLI